jgi:hypothetical protein
MAALNFPATPAHLAQYTDPNQAVWQYDSDDTVWNVITNTTRKNFSGAKRRISSAFDVNSDLQLIKFETEDYSVDDYFKATPTRVTIPTTGFYRVYVSLFTSTGGSGASYAAELRKNGVALFNVTIGPNQNVNFDETLSLVEGDYIEIFGSEAASVGQFTTDSEFLVYRIGFAPGTGISNHNAFSGVRAVLGGAVNTTSTPLPVSWLTTDFNSNANVIGDLYWYSGAPDRLTVRTSGYYRCRSFIETSAAGGGNSYTMEIEKNGTTTIDNITLGPNDQLDFDEVIALDTDDFIQLKITNTDNTGAIQSTSYLELVREGV